MAKKSKAQKADAIAVNRKALHEYHIEEKFEAGVALEGWEVKSLRAGHGQITESYVLLKHGEASIIGAQIPPLLSASTHVTPDPRRTRKLLLHKSELKKLFEATERKGYTAVALKLYWKNNRVKAQIAIAKGKKDFDKRETEKQRDWQRDKARMMRTKR